MISDRMMQERIKNSSRSECQIEKIKSHIPTSHSIASLNNHQSSHEKLTLTLSSHHTVETSHNQTSQQQPDKPAAHPLTSHVSAPHAPASQIMPSHQNECLSQTSPYRYHSLASTQPVTFPYHSDPSRHVDKEAVHRQDVLEQSKPPKNRKKYE